MNLVDERLRCQHGRYLVAKGILLQHGSNVQVSGGKDGFPLSSGNKKRLPSGAVYSKQNCVFLSRWTSLEWFSLRFRSILLPGARLCRCPMFTSRQGLPGTPRLSHKSCPTLQSDSSKLSLSLARSGCGNILFPRGERKVSTEGQEQGIIVLKEKEI